MVETALFATLISAGIAIAVQGILIRRHPQRAHPFFLERPLFNVLDLEDPEDVAKVLGRVRVVYGGFFILLGVWGLTA
jgi:hypothetical protein